ncbi:antiviral RADAR system adenosine triphosphatase RdrA [Burkholderia cepacia]|uniref:antiviral RADAR system adenosine triphosphatase RdrA n=1 Tax=Burkholderia cepacia TaxID=292 RepID=UPI002FE2F33F
MNPSRSSASPSYTYIPLDQTESASQDSNDSLLAKPVYDRLVQFISDAVESVSGSDARNNFHRNRRHNAALIDGMRGTGKSSVLVNLHTALEKRNAELAGHVHIFKPVDPTLLENGDDLFLNVIVAAVLSDKRVIEAQQRKPQQRQKLQQTLQLLGHKLESMQSQRTEQGLDKVRSFIGNHQLVEEVHRFFEAVLEVLDKKLLILTIDDVDTSLHRAFENLEVVRRYLTTPFVLPVLSGDLDLYHDVTWRDFHHRLTRDTTYQRADAYERAVQLATDYERKVLPLQYRVAMPGIDFYLSDNTIRLGDVGDEKGLPLPSFVAWLRALIGGPVNGLENSSVHVPITSLRALGQLLYRLRHLVPFLARFAHARGLTDGLSLQRALLMSPVTAIALDKFARDFVHGGDNRRIYSEFHAEVGAVDGNQLADGALTEQRDAWYSALREHFRTDPDAGQAYLVMLAHEHWRGLGQSQQGIRSVFDTPLFQPLAHRRADLKHFHRASDLRDWKIALLGRGPETWLDRLPEHTILAYPVPEAGQAIARSAYRFENNDEDGSLLRDLLLHRNFYSSSQQAFLICTGRMIELIVTSLIRDVTPAAIRALLDRPPFHSFSAIAGTKAMVIGQDDEESDSGRFVDDEIEESGRSRAVDALVVAINRWRSDHDLPSRQVSPWLVYCVVNKVLNQAWIFNRPLVANKQPTRNLDVSNIVWVARQAFYSMWAAFGSFEKGPLFGLPSVVAQMNIGDGSVIESSMLYKMNIVSFLNTGPTQGHSFGDIVGAITGALEKHPLRRLVDKFGQPPQGSGENAGARSSDGVVAKNRDSAGTKQTDGAAAKKWLQSRLGGIVLSNKPRAQTLANHVIRSYQTRLEAMRMLEQFKGKFPSVKGAAVTLQAAIDIVFPPEAT